MSSPLSWQYDDDARIELLCFAFYEFLMSYSETKSVFEASDASLRVMFLVLSGSSLMSVACAIDPLRAANRIAGRKAFDWQVVSADGSPPQMTAGLGLPVAGKFDPAMPADLFVIVSGFGSNEMRDRPLLKNIYKAAASARAVGAIEAGAWLLARTGLLDGRNATTHWEDLAEFELAFPSVNVLPDRYVIDRDVFTTGGASPTFDMMIELVRRRLGPVTAIDVSSAFIYDDWHDAADAQPHVSLGRPDRHDRRLIEAIRIMENCLDRPITIAAIARRIGVSSRMLELIFLREMRMSPGAYFLTLRINAARRLVKDSRIPLADVAERTGFASSAAFSRAYRRAFGESPSDARKAG